MIPAILAAPMVEGVVGGVIGGVMNAFSPSEPTAPLPTTNSSFSSSLNQAATAPSSAPLSSTGIMHSSEWNQMGSADIKSWAQGLAGRHVDATDASGRTISGQVNGMQMMGGVPALNIGGHLVSLSQLKQISWSPSVA
jgi:hypothetical protein